MGRRFLRVDACLREVSASLYFWIRQGPCLSTPVLSDDVLMKLAGAVKGLRIPKLSIGWELEELEALTREDVDRDTDSDDESEDEIERMLPAPLP